MPTVCAHALPPPPQASTVQLPTHTHTHTHTHPPSPAGAEGRGWQRVSALGCWTGTPRRTASQTCWPAATSAGGISPLGFPATHPAARTMRQGPGPAAGVGCSPTLVVWSCTVSGASPPKLSLLVCKLGPGQASSSWGAGAGSAWAHGPLALEPGFPSP